VEIWAYIQSTVLNKTEEVIFAIVVNIDRREGSKECIRDSGMRSYNPDVI
jgi:hypothetical protein